jgi:pimeloyl-ACP methyl ester carboxylesterase
VPTIVLTGTDDATVAPHIHARAFARAVPHARLVTLAGIGHMPHHVSADNVVAAVEQLPVRATTTVRVT